MTLLFILFLSIVNFIGITESVVINMVMAFVEIAGLVIVLIIGIWYIAEGNADFATLTEFQTADGTSPAIAILAGVALSFFAMTGFENTANVAEETIDPHKSFPRSLIGGMITAGVIYVLVSMAAALTVSTATLADSDAALLEVVEKGILPIDTGFMSTLFSVIAMIAITNTTLVAVVTQPRILYGMANEDVVPAIFAKIHPTRRSPWVGLVFSAARGGRAARGGHVRARGRGLDPDRAAVPGDRAVPAVHLRAGDRRLPEAPWPGRGRAHVPSQHPAAVRRSGRERGHLRVVGRATTRPR